MLRQADGAARREQWDVGRGVCSPFLLALEDGDSAMKGAILLLPESEGKRKQSALLLHPGVTFWGLRLSLRLGRPLSLAAGCASQYKRSQGSAPLASQGRPGWAPDTQHERCLTRLRRRGCSTPWPLRQVAEKHWQAPPGHRGGKDVRHVMSATRVSDLCSRCAGQSVRSRRDRDRAQGP